MEGLSQWKSPGQGPETLQEVGGTTDLGAGCCVPNCKYWVTQNILNQQFENGDPGVWLEEIKQFAKGHIACK